jgi:hypothetical protein
MSFESVFHGDLLDCLVSKLSPDSVFCLRETSSQYLHGIDLKNVFPCELKNEINSHVMDLCIKKYTDVIFKFRSIRLLKYYHKTTYQHKRIPDMPNSTQTSIFSKLMYDADTDFKYEIARDLNEYNGYHLIDYRIYINDGTYYTLGLNVIMHCPKITDLNYWYHVNYPYTVDDVRIIFLSNRLNSENNSLLYDWICRAADMRVCSAAALSTHTLDHVQGNVKLR